MSIGEVAERPVTVSPQAPDPCDICKEAGCHWTDHPTVVKRMSRYLNT